MRDCSAHRHARGCLLSIALALASTAGWGQQASHSGVSVADLAPFASRLRAETVDYQVKLTWRDAPDLKGAYLVYRATEEITPESFTRATLVGAAPSGTEFFIDTPPDRQGYFYAVVIRDTTGKLYPLLIPFRNKTTTAVSVQATAPEQDLAARITGIRAAVSPAVDGVAVTFTSSSPSRDLLLFWGTAPLVTAEDLLRSASTTELDPGTTRYLQPALPGIDYWFAVLDAGLYKMGQVALVPGVNATAAPVRMPMTAGRPSFVSRGAARRITPLPSLAIPFGVLSGEQSGDSGIVPTPPERIRLRRHHPDHRDPPAGNRAAIGRRNARRWSFLPIRPRSPGPSSHGFSRSSRDLLPAGTLRVRRRLCLISSTCGARRKRRRTRVSTSARPTTCRVIRATPCSSS